MVQPVATITSDLSAAQRHLWSLAGPSPNTPFRSHCSIAIRGPIDYARLVVRLRAIASREELLRTTFRTDPDSSLPIPIVADDGAPALRRVDLSAADVGQQHALARLAIRQVADAAFKWERGPLFLCVLTTMSAAEHVLTIMSPAICSDGIGLENLARVLLDEHGGQDPVPYRALAAWREERLTAKDGQAEREFWRRHAAGASRSVPHPFERPLIERTIAGAGPLAFSRAVVIQPVDAEMRAAIAAASRQIGVAPASLLMTAWAVLFARLTGDEDVALGVVCDGRLHPETAWSIGPLSRMVPWSGRIAGHRTFADLAVDVDAQRGELAACEPYLSWPSGASSPVVCGFEYDERIPPAASRERYTVIERESRGEPYAITLVCGLSGDHLTAAFHYDECRFARVDVERVGKQFLALLADAAARPQTPVRRLDLLDAAERRRVVSEWNDTFVHEGHECVHELFEAQVERDPSAAAVVYEDRVVTYGELNARANKLARTLRRRGVGPDVCVGVCLERSVELVVALLAVLKAGGAYLPLDPEYPPARLAFIAEESRTPIVLTVTRLRDCVDSAPTRILCLDAEAAEMDAEETANLHTGVTGGNLAYVIYTSGSTGKPKGVMNVHAGLRNRLRWGQGRWALSSRDRVLQKTRFSFDVSVWEFFWPLTSGACLVVARPGGHQDGAYLGDLIARAQVTLTHFVPSMLDAFLRGPWIERCSSLRWVHCSGEALPASVQSEFHDRCNGELHNLYGPTETSIEVTHWACRRQKATGTVTIGRPIDNTQIYVLDAEMQPVPAGVAGELYIGGVSLARGYLRRPDLTAERFVPDPLSVHAGARLYRSGDLGRYLPDGSVEFLGRTDHQVKIRGYRIEIDEIESALDGHPSVQRSLVVAREDVPGHKRLVAYIVPNTFTVDAAALRAHLSATLPEYMVPSAFVPLADLPVTPNGKVDRQALPPPDESGQGRAHVAPRTAAEAALARIWADVLRVDRVSIDANFFELGGDSILSIQIVARANQVGLFLTPRQIFEHQTVAELALAAAPAPSWHDAPDSTNEWAPLTPIQTWFFAQRLADPNHFNQAVLLQPRERLDETRLRTAVAAVLRHHPALRSRFEEADGIWRQRVLDEEPAEPKEPEEIVEVVDLAGVVDAEPASAWRDRLAREADRVQASLDIARGPLARVCLVRTADGDRLLVAIHHLVVDGVSWRILVEDLQRAYEQAGANEAIDLGRRTTSFARWASALQQHANGAAAAAEAMYWSDLAERAAQLGAPAELGIGRGPYAATERVEVSMTEAETKALLTRLPAIYGTQITEVLLTALGLALREWGGATSQLVDVESHGREEEIGHVDLSRTVGWFTALYPVLIATPDNNDIEAFLAAVKEQMRALPHRGLGYGLLRHLDPRTAPQRTGPPRTGPLASIDAPVVFNYLGQVDQVFGEDALFARAPESAGMTQAPENLRAHELSINAIVADDRLTVTFGYAARSTGDQRIPDLAAAYLVALRSILHQARTRETRRYTPSDFPLAAADQATLDELARTCGDIEDVYPLLPLQEGLLFHSVFEPDTEQYFDQLTSRVRGAIDRDAFDHAWHGVVERHAALRTAFVWNRVNEPLQVVRPNAQLEIVHEDWRGVPEAELRTRLETWRVADRQRGFDLARPPLMRLALFRTGESEHYLVWSRHHLLLDGWSRALLLREVIDAYEAFRRGTRHMPKTAASTREYMAWRGRQDVHAAETYWRETLRGFTGLPALGLERRVLPSTQAAGYGDQRHTLDAGIAARLRELTRTNQITLNTVMQGMWALLLARYTGQRDVVFGTVVAGRPADLPGVEAMLGMFINTLPVRVTIDPGEAVVPWLRGLQQQQAVQRAFEFSPLAHVHGWSELAHGASGGGRRLFDSILVFENFPNDPMAGGRQDSLQFDELETYLHVNVALALTVMPGAETTFQISYDHNRLSSAAITRVFSHVEAALAAVIADPGAPLAQVDRALDEYDRRQQALVATTLERTRADRLTVVRRKAMRVM